MIKAYLDSVQKLLKDNVLYRLLIIILMALTITILILIFLNIKFGLVSVPIIFSSLRGVIYLVDWYQFYIIAFIAIFNFLISIKFVRILNERYRYFAYTYIISVILLQIFLLTSVSLLISQSNV